MDTERLRTLSDHIEQMTRADLIAELYLNPYGLQNRKAFDLLGGGRKYVVLIDIDSLKWANDTFGHEAGDDLICRMSQALGEEFGHDAYHLSGDEFAVVCNEFIFTPIRMNRVRQALKVVPNDAVYPYAVGFSFGVGETLTIADQMMQKDKRLRTRMGERAERGNPPPMAAYEEELKCGTRNKA